MGSEGGNNSSVEHSMKHIMAIVDMFESNNKNLNEPEDTIFLTVYGILCCLAGGALDRQTN